MLPKKQAALRLAAPSPTKSVVMNACSVGTWSENRWIRRAIEPFS